MWSISELKLRADKALKANYRNSVLISGVFFMLFCGGISNSLHIDLGDILPLPAKLNISGLLFKMPESKLGTIITVAVIIVLTLLIKAFIINPLQVGVARFELNALNSDGKFSDIGYGFRTSYMRNVKAMFMCSLYILIGFILFIIPGIIMSYQFMMVPYILAENSDIDRKEALKLSEKYMEGNKWDTLYLDWSFLLWHVLGKITFGIAELFYVGPYLRLTHAALYEAIKK